MNADRTYIIAGFNIARTEINVRDKIVKTVDSGPVTFLFSRQPTSLVSPIVSFGGIVQSEETVSLGNVLATGIGQVFIKQGHVLECLSLGSETILQNVHIRELG